jgi:ribosomal protein S20
MIPKKVPQIENLDSEKILSEFRKVNERIDKLAKKSKFSIKSYYTRKEVKELLGVSYPTLNTWEKRGILKTCRIGGRVVYRADDLEEAIVPTKNTSCVGK